MLRFCQLAIASSGAVDSPGRASRAEPSRVLCGAFAKCQSGAVHQFKCEINRNGFRSQSLAFCYNFRAICCRLCLSVRQSVRLSVCLSDRQRFGEKKKRSEAAALEPEAGRNMLKVFTITQRLIEIDFGLIGWWYAHREEFFHGLLALWELHRLLSLSFCAGLCERG